MNLLKEDSCIEGTGSFYVRVHPIAPLNRKTAVGIASTMYPFISFSDHKVLFKRIDFSGEYLERNERYPRLIATCFSIPDFTSRL